MKPFALPDAAFFWLEGRQQPMHVGGLQLYSPAADVRRGAAARLMEAFRQFDQPVPPYNQRPVFRLGHWFWEEDNEFDLDYHLRHSVLPKPGRIRELLGLVSRLHGSLMDRTRPMWEVHVIEGLRDGRVALYVKIHHALFDGVGAMRAMQACLSTDPAQIKPAFWALPLGRRDSDGSSAGSDAADPIAGLLAQLRGGARVVPGILRGLWETLRARTDDADATPFQAPPTMFNVPISGSRRFAAQSYSLARMKDIGKSHGATLNDMALAVCAGALRQYLLAHQALPEPPLIAMVPVSVRAAGAEGGNHIATVLVNLATDIADPVTRLKRIMQSTLRAKEKMAKMTRVEQIAYAATLMAPLQLTTMTRLDRIHPLFNLVISNVPGPRVPLYLQGQHLDEMYPLSIPLAGQALNITLTSYCDQLGVGFTACRRAVPGMQRLLDYTEQSLAELERPSRR